MKKNIFLLLSACLLCMGQVMASNVLTVSDVIVPQGGQATIEIGGEFDTEYTAFELQLSLPEGLSLLTDEEGYPIIEKTFDTNHILTGNLLPSNGNYKITCRSMDNISMPTSGSLFHVTVLADANLTLGANLSASVTACEFTRTADSNGESLSDAAFTVHITEYRTILNENSTTMPTAETNANVRVKRILNADEWSTLCLPFAMTAAQVTAAFGDDVQLADFTSWTSEEDDDTGDIVSIEVSFTAISAIAANHPCLIKVSKAIEEFTVDGVDVDPEDEPSIKVGRNKATRGFFTGTYVAGTAVPENNLFLSGNKFWYSTGATTTKAFRGYFELADVLTSVEEGAGTKVRFSIDGETTAIRSIENGEQRINNEDGIYYTLDGRKLNGKPMEKGMYIVNGKKVLKK